MLELTPEEIEVLVKRGGENVLRKENSLLLQPHLPPVSTTCDPDTYPPLGSSGPASAWSALSLTFGSMALRYQHKCHLLREVLPDYLMPRYALLLVNIRCLIVKYTNLPLCTYVGSTVKTTP